MSDKSLTQFRQTVTAASGAQLAKILEAAMVAGPRHAMLLSEVTNRLVYLDELEKEVAEYEAEQEHRIPRPATPTPSGPKYLAKFYPQAWVQDNAVTVDPLGPDEWEPAHVPDSIAAELDEHPMDAVLDTDDELKADANAPQWIKDWTGPFSIFVGIPEPKA